MQQKSKFIIFLTLICFIFLLFLPREAWGLINYDFPSGGTALGCETCADGYLKWHPASGTPGTANYSPAGNTFICTEWDETSCPNGGDGDDDKEKGWRCRMDLGGVCQEYEAKNPKYGSLAACEAKCPYGTYKHCGTAGCETGDCIKSFWYNVDPGDECDIDADCVNGGTPPPTSNGDTPSNGGTPPSNGWTPPPTSPPPTSPPPTLPEVQPCMINYFELPERAWVDYPITGRWSAGAWCDDCDVDCTPYPECVWKQDSIGTGFDEYKFTLEQPGTYNYILTCYGEGGIDERTETATVEAFNLPWWREIIPVLQGFLRGIWG